MHIPPNANISAEKLSNYLLIERPWDDKSKYLARAGFGLENPLALQRFIMKSIALYERVALTRDLAEHHLKAGDVATVVEIVPHPSGGPEGYVLEVSNALGESLQVVIVTANDIEPLHANEVLSVRQLAIAP
jgi:hypothetical protein